MKEDTALGVGRKHTLSMENRTRCVITGVEDVDCFNEQLIVVITQDGALTLAGQGLHVESLDLKEGRLIAAGRVDAMEYDDRAARKKSGLFRRALK